MKIQTKAKDLISLLLSLIMLASVFTALPFTANAVNTDVKTTSVTSSNFEYEVLDDGTAEITVYTNESTSNLEIPGTLDGHTVTSIGDYAFSDCISLTSVTIPDSITNIGASAFEGCTNLKNVTISNSVTSIGEYAFGYYYDDNGEEEYKVENFTITGYSGTAAETYANENGFEFISLGEVPSKGNEDISKDIDYDILDDGTAEIIGYNGSSAKVEIPVALDGHTVTSIGDYAFSDCISLTSVTIPDSITNIGASAFEGCTNLKNVTISNSVTSIGEYAFGYYYDDGGEEEYKVENFTITGYSGTAAETYANENGFKFISLGEVPSKGNEDISKDVDYDILDDGTAEIIGYNGSSAKIEIPVALDGHTVISIGDYAFSDCISLTSVTIPDGITNIGASAFESCTNLNNVTIPNSVISIGENAFNDTAWYNNQPDGLIYAGKVAYKYKGNCPETVIIKEGTTGIAGRAFYGCQSLRNVTIPNSVTRIGNGAFDDTAWYNNQPNGLVYAGRIAYKYKGNCPETVVLKKGTTEVASCAFYGCTRLKKVTIPNSVTGIGDLAFYNCKSLKSITIPSSVTSIGYFAFGYYYDVIDDEDYTLDDFIIKGYSGTAAENYANENDIEFFNIGGASTTKTTITLKKSSDTVYVKGKTQIKATVKNGKGKTIYKSSNKKIAKVSSSGKITGVKKGKTTITVTNNKVTKKFTINVKNPKLNKTLKSIKKGKTFNLKITGKVGKAKFTSSNKKVASVNKNGKITTKKKGKATITVKTNGLKLKCIITVK